MWREPASEDVDRSSVRRSDATRSLWAAGAIARSEGKAGGSPGAIGMSQPRRRGSRFRRTCDPRARDVLRRPRPPSSPARAPCSRRWCRRRRTSMPATGEWSGDRLAAPSRARDAGRAGSARRGGSDARRGRAGRSDDRPGPRGGVARGPLRGEGARVGAAAPARPRRPPRGPRRSLYIEPDRSSPLRVPARERGHTLLLAVHEQGSSHRLGTTLDDAAGEAFDKGARLLGLGYPGGAEIDRLAREGDPEAFAFPVARVQGLDFSFSGLKTALLYAVRDLGRPRPRAGEPIWPPRTSARSCARSSAVSTRRPSRPGSSASPSSAESRPTAACARLCPRRGSLRSRCARTTRR